MADEAKKACQKLQAISEAARSLSLVSRESCVAKGPTSASFSPGSVWLICFRVVSANSSSLMGTILGSR
jgi:hypothetical protein